MHVARLPWVPFCAVALGLSLAAACSASDLDAGPTEDSGAPATSSTTTSPTTSTTTGPTTSTTTGPTTTSPPPPVDASPTDATADAEDADASADAAPDALDATPDALDAAPDSAGPCNRTSPSFPACRGGDRRVFAVSCTRTLHACNGTVTSTPSSAELTVDLYPAITATTIGDYGLPAATGAAMATPTYRFIIGQGSGNLRASGSLEGLSLAAIAPGAGYNELHRYSVNRASMTFSSTSHFQSRGPCGGGGPQMTDFNCSGGLKP